MGPVRGVRLGAEVDVGLEVAGAVGSLPRRVCLARSVSLMRTTGLQAGLVVVGTIDAHRPPPSGAIQ